MLHMDILIPTYDYSDDSLTADANVLESSYEDMIRISECFSRSLGYDSSSYVR
jgi:hypothetical protein